MYACTHNVRVYICVTYMCTYDRVNLFVFMIEFSACILLSFACYVDACVRFRAQVCGRAGWLEHKLKNGIENVLYTYYNYITAFVVRQRNSAAAHLRPLGNYIVVSSIITPRNNIAKLDFCPPPRSRYYHRDINLFKLQSAYSREL